MAQLRNLPLNGSQPELLQPESGWRPYQGPLPRLCNVAVGIDTETRDDGLASSKGPGWVYDRGYLCGVSVATEDTHLYVPVRHPDSECRDLPEVLEWLGHIFEHCECHFFNAGYDLGWLRQAGLRSWPRRLHDASIQAVMLDENEYEYGLDVCAARRGVAGKDTRLLEEAARAYGVDPKSGLFRMLARFVGPYAERDAAATLALSRLQLADIRRDRMEEAYDTEIRLVRVIHEMRHRGIRISEDAAEQSQQRIRARRDAALEAIRHESGFRMDMHSLRSPDAVGKLFQEAGIDCPLTPRSRKPSVTREWLAALDHPLGHLVRQARRFDDLSEKFMGTYILGHVHRGRIHAEVHQLRDEEGGARTSRLSYSNPPLQQMPARPDRDDPPEDKALVAEIRSAFVPEDGEVWFAPDYSGQEPRFLVHIAALCKMPGAAEMVERYRANPRLDYHQSVADILGWPRAQAKDTNQGLAYGMGLDKLARTLRCSREEAEEKLEAYHAGMPYVRATTSHCSNMAKSRGWIRLVDGARRHFDHWQPVRHRDVPAVKGYEAARVKWPNAQLERAYTHKALNSACQGGSARQMKIAMVQCWEAGHLPLVSMHDELCFSATSRAQCEAIGEIMVSAVRLQVPMLVDLEAGPDWGHAKRKLEEIFGQ